MLAAVVTAKLVGWTVPFNAAAVASVLGGGVGLISVQTYGTKRHHGDDGMGLYIKGCHLSSLLFRYDSVSGQALVSTKRATRMLALTYHPIKA